MSSKNKLYRPVGVFAMAGVIGIVMIGAIAFSKEPIASADTISSVLYPSEASTTAQTVAQASAPKTLDAKVYRDPNCGCCEAWVKYLRSNGFRVSVIQEPHMNAVKRKHNVPNDLASCHTAIINGAVIEGHVPAEDIKQFLSQKSEAIGLAVPDMPIGSPGMESGDTKQPFTVFSFDRQGKAKGFNQYWVYRNKGT